MKDVDLSAQAPCRRGTWNITECVCPDCLRAANEVAAVLLTWADDRDDYIAEYEDLAHQELVELAEREGGVPVGDDERMEWYWDDLQSMDEYVVLALDEGAHVLWSMDRDDRRAYLLAHPEAKSQAPCRKPYARAGICDCPEHRDPAENTVGAVAERLWKRRAAMQEQFDAGARSPSGMYESQQLSAMQGWLLTVAGLDFAELGALGDLTSSGLTLEQARLALHLTHGRQSG